MTMLASAPAQAASTAASTGGDLLRGFSSLSSRLTDRLKDSGLENLVSGVKNFLPAVKDLTTTRLVASLLEPSSASSQALQETENWLMLDIQGRRGGRAGPTPMTASGFNANASVASAGKRDAIVFVVGGGSYVEYCNLMEWNARNAIHQSARRITYGATEILTPSAFVHALGNLAD
jgi:hypothetical protein